MDLEGYCKMCDDDLMSSGRFYKDVLVCMDCEQFLEENDGYTGELMIVSCKECGHIKKVWFKKYKKLDRKLCSENKSKLSQNYTLDKFKGGVVDG